MRIEKIVIATALAAASMLAVAQDTVRPRMTREQAEKLMEQDGTAVMQENLPVNLMNGKADIVEAMLLLGVDPNGKLEQAPQTTLEFAVSTCAGQRVAEADINATVEVLLRAGARPDDVGMLGTMIVAAQQCPPSVVKRLIAGGAKLDVRTPQGFTPLSMALIVGNYDAAEALIDAGAKLSAEGAAKLSDGVTDNPRLLALVKRASAK